VKNCLVCHKLLKNTKNYCNRTCYLLKPQKTKIEKRNCLKCNIEFEFRSKLKRKYCTRLCKDLHQKEIYKNTGNPLYGKKWSVITRNKFNISIQIYWSNENNRTKHKKLLHDISKEKGCWFGTSDLSCEKRLNTYIKKYGVSHPWKNPEIRKKCEDTTFSLYKKHSWDIAKSKTAKRNTDIEIIMSNLLSLLGVSYIKCYNIVIDNDKREYDFYLPDFNILIECDGDYFHANNNRYDQTKLSKTQLNTIKNDKFKNNLAQNGKYKLLRFWGTEIKNKNFIIVLKDKIWEK